MHSVNACMYILLVILLFFPLVIGDKVNMAARLMTKFPDGLTCDDTTRLKSNLPPETFVLAPPVKLKGIPTPEDIFFVSTNEK